MAKNSTATVVETETTEAPAEAPVEQAPEQTPRDLALAAKVKTTVTAPISGRTMTVQHRYRAGGVLLTEDGEGLYGGMSKAVEAGTPDEELNLVAFEFVGGERDGQWGFLNRKRGDNRQVRLESGASS